jgi:hypothetical protein
MHHGKRDKSVTQQIPPLLASHSLAVADAYRIEERALNGQSLEVVVEKWTTRGQDCWPLREPLLVEDFAGVTGETSLRQFNEKYGLLGYHVLHAGDMGRENWRGDPVRWAVAHARIAASILGVVEIISDVRLGHRRRSTESLVRSLLQEFREMKLKVIATREPSLLCELRWKTPEALISNRDGLRLPFSSRWGNDPIGTAYRVVSWVLNNYVKTIRLGFASVGYAERFFRLTKAPARFGPELNWSSLLEVIYWRLAECVGGAFRQCPRCGSVFPTKASGSGRPSEFCSTRCGNAERQQRRRDRRKNRKRKNRPVLTA